MERVNATTRPACHVGRFGGRPRARVVGHTALCWLPQRRRRERRGELCQRNARWPCAEGYSRPGTMTLDRLYADYTMDKVPLLLAELQRRGVDLIITHAAATPIVVKDKE